MTPNKIIKNRSFLHACAWTHDIYTCRHTKNMQLMHAAGPRSIQKQFFLPRLQMVSSVYICLMQGSNTPSPSRQGLQLTDRTLPVHWKLAPPILVGLVACGLTVSHNIIFHSPPYIWPACKCSQPVTCLLYTSPSPRDKRQTRMPSSA